MQPQRYSSQSRVPRAAVFAAQWAAIAVVVAAAAPTNPAAVLVSAAAIVASAAVVNIITMTMAWAP